ncbi:MAG: hypothetical protein NT076_03050, partial [Candidatus Pacearchaeota archaeon]|nr:hypothetical protein [Candidatus Pacearchaeota archaeon]
VPRGSDVTLVAGGCGIGGLSFPAKRFSQMGNRVITLIGAKDKKHLAYLDRFERYGEVHVATEEGDYGVKGMVSSLLDSIDIPTRGYFFNCGPRAMVEAILQREIDMSSADKVFSAIEYLTMCGVGVCGKCVDSKGRRTCVEGPFMPAV